MDAQPGLQPNRANRAEGSLGLGSEPRAETETEHARDELANPQEYMIRS